MPNLETKELYQTKSYSSIYDLVLPPESNKKCKYKHCSKPIQDFLTFSTLTGDSIEMKSASKIISETQYVTSERYYSLNKKSSDKSVIRSTSTFFCDLDSLAKRHSYHCKTEILESIYNIKSKQSEMTKNGFGAKSEAIVQECATQIKPRLLTEKNIKQNKQNKKRKEKRNPNDSHLLSEAFLKETDDKSAVHEPRSDDVPENKRHQKFWSFAKYKMEYTKPVADQEKPKTKDRGKRTEDPCPCQLFSYACPCTNKKSLTELANNSKSLTLADQMTNTSQLVSEEKKDNKNNKTKKAKDVIVSYHKWTSVTDMIERKSNETLLKKPQSWNMSNNLAKKRSDDIITNVMKTRSSGKARKTLCPNCKVLVDVISTTEEKESLKSKSSPLNRDKEMSATATYTYQDVKGSKNNIFESRDTCNHDPQCELVPVCQFLPTDNIYINPNITSKQSSVKPNPRVIRITKGCRHHPPCTVVPSCQRIHVLKNNCEYIPPCLHRPRCINLPLCAPLSKSIYYEEFARKPGKDLKIKEWHHLQPNTYIPNLQQESLENPIKRIQNTCEYLSACSPRFMLNPTFGCISKTTSPCPPVPLSKYCKFEKSCQFDLLDWKQNCIDQEMYQKQESRDDVIFIRDVGCQFRNKSYSPKHSISKTSSDSFNSLNMTLDKYYESCHTVRYEDKFTIPISDERLSVSTVTLSSTEIDLQCPTHGRRQNRDNQKCRPKGFALRSNTLTPFVDYCHIDPAVNFCFTANDNIKKKKADNK